MTDPLESNSYAVAYRLLGSQAAAWAVASTAAQRVRSRFGADQEADISNAPVEVWLPMLIDFTIDQSVRIDGNAHGDTSHDEFLGLREAMRRRLVRASRQERVVSALVHLCGYPESTVASMLKMSPDAVRTASIILDPPPGIDYRKLGDPDLIGQSRDLSNVRVQMPLPSTVLVAAILLIVILFATRCTGPRPTLVDEGSLGGPVQTHMVHQPDDFEAQPSVDRF